MSKLGHPPEAELEVAQQQLDVARATAEIADENLATTRAALDAANASLVVTDDVLADLQELLRQVARNADLANAQFVRALVEA